MSAEETEEARQEDEQLEVAGNCLTMTVAMAKKETNSHQLGIGIVVTKEGNQAIAEWALVVRNLNNEL